MNCLCILRRIALMISVALSLAGWSVPLQSQSIVFEVDVESVRRPVLKEGDVIKWVAINDIDGSILPFIPKIKDVDNICAASSDPETVGTCTIKTGTQIGPHTFRYCSNFTFKVGQCKGKGSIHRLKVRVRQQSSGGGEVSGTSNSYELGITTSGDLGPVVAEGVKVFLKNGSKADQEVYFTDGNPCLEEASTQSPVHRGVCTTTMQGHTEESYRFPFLCDSCSDPMLHVTRTVPMSDRIGKKLKEVQKALDQIAGINASEARDKAEKLHEATEFLQEKVNQLKDAVGAVP